jgi:ankyrin repeat protein
MTFSWIPRNRVILAGATPLILAGANRRSGVVQLLLARGADRTATTDRGFTGQNIIGLLQRLGQGAINLHIT